MNICAIIPARGGSKGIPRKNIKLIAGKPLIAHTIEFALKSRYINRLVVSTEDKEISEISKSYGAEIVKRPQELALDYSPTIKSVEHVLNVLEEEKYETDLIVLLQATSPLRTTEDIDNAIKIFLKEECNAVVSVCIMERHKVFQIENNYLKSFMGENLDKRRQDMPDLYTTNGAIYIIKPQILQKYRSFYPLGTIPYIMPLERSVDIDTDFEFQIAEYLLKK